jgi:outer membrane protein TolC
LRIVHGTVGVVGVVMLTWGATARAAESPRAVTLQEARNYAREHQPSVRASLARVAAAKADAAVPRAQWLPQLGATAQLYVATTNNTTALYLNTPQVDAPRIGGTAAVDASHATFQPYGSTFAGVGVSQEVFDFGRIGAQASAADALVDVARHASDTTTLDVDFAVEESFYAVLAAKGVLDASEQAYDRTRTHRDFAKANVASGLFPPIELTRAEAQLARFDIARIRARGGVTTSQAVLAAAVGAPDLTLDASGALPAYQDVPTLRAAIEESASRDPRVREALAKVRAQEARTKAIFAEMRPDLSATGTFSMRAGGAPPTSGISADLNGWLPSVPNWDVGLVFTWPLYDATIVARGRASEARAEALREDVAALKQALTADVQRAYIAVEIARDALPGLERAATAAVANYEQADARFKAGLGTAIEIADAEALRAQTEIDLALGKFDLAKARAQLDRAIARNLEKRALAAPER